LHHLAPGIEIYNHDRLDLISKGQVSKHAGTSKQDCDAKHTTVKPRSGGSMKLVLTNQEDHNTTQNLREFPRFLHGIGDGDDQPDTL
jgi:hypothetical protein